MPSTSRARAAYEHRRKRAQRPGRHRRPRKSTSLRIFQEFSPQSAFSFMNVVSADKRDHQDNRSLPSHAPRSLCLKIRPSYSIACQAREPTDDPRDQATINRSTRKGTGRQNGQQKEHITTVLKLGEGPCQQGDGLSRHHRRGRIHRRDGSRPVLPVSADDRYTQGGGERGTWRKMGQELVRTRHTEGDDKNGSTCTSAKDSTNSCSSSMLPSCAGGHNPGRWWDGTPKRA